MNSGLKIRSAILASALGLIALSSTPAHAVIGTMDRVPAATLLLPYFEVDEVDPNGPQTRFTVVNASDTQQMAHVTLWTDMGVPTFAFDLYLGGRDSVEVDLRLLFSVQGIAPQTSPTLFSNGPDSNVHTSVGTCSAGAMYAGFPIPNQLTGSQVSHIRRAHRGDYSPLFGNMCSGANHGGDNVARGYITIDAVNACSGLFPTDVGYFGGGGTGVASDNNVLFGTYTTIERGQNVSTASPLVSIEASSTDAMTTTPGFYTFYAGYVGAAATDNREGIGSSVWRARHVDVGFFDPGADFVVWRDPGFKHQAFVCGTTPSDFPRQHTYIVGFDEQEHGAVLNSGNPYPNPPPPPVYPVGLVAQRVPASALSPFPSGVVQLDLDVDLTSKGMPPTLQGGLQSYVGVRQRFNGYFGAELPAAQVIEGTNLCIGCFPPSP